MLSDQDRELLAIKHALETEIGRSVVGIAFDQQARDGTVLVKIGHIVIDDLPLPERIDNHKITYHLVAPSRLNFE